MCVCALLGETLSLARSEGSPSSIPTQSYVVFHLELAAMQLLDLHTPAGT